MLGCRNGVDLESLIKCGLPWTYVWLSSWFCVCAWSQELCLRTWLVDTNALWCIWPWRCLWDVYIDLDWWLRCPRGSNKLKRDYQICSGLIHSGEQYQDKQGLCIFVSGIQFGELSVFEVTSLELKCAALLSWIGLTKEWYSDILSRNEMCWCTDCCNVCLSNWIEDTLCDNLWNSRLICCYDMHRWPWDFFGCWAWLGIDLRGDNSGEKVRGCGNAETEQLYPFSFWCCANETSHGSFCGHHGVVRAAVALNYY